MMGTWSCEGGELDGAKVMVVDREERTLRAIHEQIPSCGKANVEGMDTCRRMDEWIGKTKIPKALLASKQLTINRTVYTLHRKAHIELSATSTKCRQQCGRVHIQLLHHHPLQHQNNSRAFNGM